MSQSPSPERYGKASFTKALTPVTCGVAIDVPVISPYLSPFLVELILTPGAITVVLDNLFPGVLLVNPKKLASSVEDDESRAPTVI